MFDAPPRSTWVETNFTHPTLPASGARSPAAPVEQQVRAVLAVVSAWRGAGRTTVAAGLARAFARRGARVALVGVDGSGDLLALPACRGVFTHCVRPADVQDPAAWRIWQASLRASHDLIVVDSSAGYRGTTEAVLATATHWLATIPVHGAWNTAVVPPEAIPPSATVRALQPAGIVFNGFRVAATATLPAMRAADLQQLVVDTVLPWSPLLAHDGDHNRTGWLFDDIADDIAPRLTATTIRSPLARIALRPTVAA